MNKWILDNEGSCIRCNDIPILEGSFHKKDCEHALKLASKAPEMLEMLSRVLDCQAQAHTLPSWINEEIESLIKEATEL
ncbi:hypothetical protein [Elizabethkingia ursingii]